MTASSSLGFFAFLTVAAGAGAATFFSPCAYALLPGYVAYYVAEAGGERGRAPLVGALFRGGAATAGVLAVFVALFGVAVSLGEAIRDYLPTLELLVGVTVIALGAAIVAGIDLSVHVELPERRSTVAGFFGFGVLYAVAAAGCVAPLFLSIVLESITLPTHRSVVALGAYAGTFGALMLGVTVVTAVGHGVSTDIVAKHADRLVRAAGVVIVLAGIGQIYVSGVVV
jgi:cytochrome c-type biogenesis protein